MNFIDALTLYMFTIAYHELAHFVAAKYFGVFNSVVIIRKPGILGLIFNGVGIGTDEFERPIERYAVSLAPLVWIVPGVMIWPFNKAIAIVMLGAAVVTISDIASMHLGQQDSSKWKYTVLYPREGIV